MIVTMIIFLHMPTLMQENEFLVPARWWECASNWLTKDNSPAEHPPCGDDNAVFETVGMILLYAV